MSRSRRKVVGANIRRAREDAGLSQDEFARDLGTTRTRLSDWERGRHEPNWKWLGAIADRFDAPRAAFYMEVDDDELAAARFKIATGPGDWHKAFARLPVGLLWVAGWVLLIASLVDNAGIDVPPL